MGAEPPHPARRGFAPRTPLLGVRVGGVNSAETAAPVDVIDQVAEGTVRLLEGIRGMSEKEVGEPSLLPGWTRGHVLAHIARNADSLVNLLTWARTGVVTPQYASVSVRDQDIEDGAPRGLAEQLADVDATAAKWLELARTAPEQSWTATVRNRQGGEMPGSFIPWMRLREVEIHHVDLGIGYQPADWPESFVTRLLPEAAIDLTKVAAKSETPTTAFAVSATDTGFTATIGAGEPDRTVSGPANVLLAWLLGRSVGADLSGQLPVLPAWK
ncbi:maleylpyruvate isomerase family mycothiol-dependent enzyme [Nocardia sp. NPDC051832]|uniref:maleylpyruvate isomerase family mycothiol-dependent enzyme n=1 Tax=Nocardia sp. NPDC051832 TaxID=3155673 RepID=UPI0034360BE2